MALCFSRKPIYEFAIYTLIDIVTSIGKRKREFRATSAPPARFTKCHRIVVLGHSGATSTMNRTVSEARTHEGQRTGYVGISRLHLEGIVLQRSSYKSGPSKAWLKIKNPKAPAATRAIDGTF
jgi:hypothetical protein